MRRLAIYGTGGLAREVLELVRAINGVADTYDVIGWLDDDPDKRGAELKSLPILGAAENAVEEQEPFSAIIAIGNTVARRRLAMRLGRLGVPSPVLIAPNAWVGNDVRMGPGTVVCAGSNITTDIRIGEHVIVNLDATIGHDAALEDFVTIAPSVNISGNVTVGEGSDIGTGTATVQGVRIGSWSIVGAGAVVARDVPANVTALGVPAKVIKERTSGWHEDPASEGA